MWKYDSNKVTKQICWSHTSAWMLSCKFAAYFPNTFSQEHLGMAAFVRSLQRFSWNREKNVFQGTLAPAFVFNRLDIQLLLSRQRQ